MRFEHRLQMWAHLTHAVSLLHKLTLSLLNTVFFYWRHWQFHRSSLHRQSLKSGQNCSRKFVAKIGKLRCHYFQGNHGKSHCVKLVPQKKPLFLFGSLKIMTLNLRFAIVVHFEIVCRCQKCPGVNAAYNDNPHNVNIRCHSL